MNVIWHGTASIELENEEGKILFDPFVSLEGSNVAVKIEDYDGFSDIFVTHGHFDHIYNIPEIIKRNPNAKVYCTNNPYCVLRKKGVPEINLQRINYDDTFPPITMPLDLSPILKRHKGHVSVAELNRKIVV